MTESKWCLSVCSNKTASSIKNAYYRHNIPVEAAPPLHAVFLNTSSCRGAHYRPALYRTHTQLCAIKLAPQAQQMRPAGPTASTHPHTHTRINTDKTPIWNATLYLFLKQFYHNTLSSIPALQRPYICAPPIIQNVKRKDKERLSHLWSSSLLDIP